MVYQAVVSVTLVFKLYTSFQGKVVNIFGRQPYVRVKVQVIIIDGTEVFFLKLKVLRAHILAIFAFPQTQIHPLVYQPGQDGGHHAIYGVANCGAVETGLDSLIWRYSKPIKYY